MTKNLFKLATVFAVLSLFNFACQKDREVPTREEELSTTTNKSSSGHLQQAKTFGSEVVTVWLNMQLSMLRIPLPIGTGSQATERCQAYCGIAAYEAVVNGMPAYQSLSGQLNGLPAMPATQPGKAYHWAASANAALAEMNRKLFPTTAESNKIRINQVEDSLKAVYANDVPDETLQRSIVFGKEVATRVATWAASDGSAIINPPYVAPVGPGLWIPTSPTPAVNPYAYQRRRIVPGSENGTALVPLPPYSTNPSSDFYAMVKEVYDVSFTLTTDQKAMADYFKDVPGYGPGGGFISVLSQALSLAEPTLDKAVLAYAKVGLSQHEATLTLFVDKYIFNTIRPVTYIRAVIDPTWLTYIPTPNHPEFPSGHATTNGAVLTMMSNSFGENFSMTLHTYDYLGYAPRTYNTFTAMGLDMANSRLYGGLHYRATCERSLVQGRKVAENILSTIEFKK
ncbi:MAG: vanadium-dependent haloperoxidase [Chitinophagaceae bacterium]|nr:vanadium-dependent haloperoxidase [Chitinophagaceae bacterium]